MGSRIAASAIVVAGVAALLWVMLGGSSSEPASLPVATTPDSPTQPAVPATNTGDETSDEEAIQDTTRQDTAVQDTAVQDSDDSEAASDPVATAAPEPDADAPENLGPRMGLDDLDGWLNTDATSIDDFDGKVVLVEMWTFGCHNCKARIPFNQSYVEQFADENFEIVGVHAPEFSYEAEIPNIEAALVDLGVTWPIALDTEKKNFRAWQPGTRSFWPRSYVIDQNGDIRYDHIGEGKYEELRDTIQYLLDNPPPAPTSS